MIDLSPSSLRVLAIMILVTVWFWLVIDTIMNSNREE